MNFPRLRPRRLLAGVLAGALAFSASPLLGVQAAGAADALPPLATPIGAGNFCEGMPTTEPFTDVAPSDPSINEIICLVSTKLTQGTTATTYSPNASITRRQMALFIKRTADLANKLEIAPGLTALPAYDGVPDFTDIAGESTAVKEAIGQLSQADIVQGTTAATYSPREFVTRRQMAAFINRLEKFLTGTAFSTTKDYFNDDTGDSGEANLNAVASVGIFQGDGAGNVDPGGNLTRRQMANVLLRHLQVMFKAGDIKRAFDPAFQAFTVAGANEAHGFGAAGARTCNVTVPSGTVVSAVLVASEEITISSGIVSFSDPNSNELYEPAAVEPEITAVNGAPVTAADQINGITSGGTIAVTFSEGSVPDDVMLLVFANPASGNNLLDLTNATPNNAQPKTAAEDFGIGCRTFFVPAEATLATHTGQTSDIVNRDLDYFVDNATPPLDSTDTFYWDANDVFQFNGIGITQAPFEGVLSSGASFDTLTVTYNPDAAGVSTFNITTDVVGAPAGVTATVVNNDVTVVFTPSALNGPATVFDIVADNVTDNQLIEATEAVLANNAACTPSATTGQCTLTLNNAPNGTYDILVRAENPPTTQVSAIADSADITVPSVADGTAPLAIDSVVTRPPSPPPGDTFVIGYEFKVVFNEAMGAPVSGDRIRAQDNDSPAPATIADFVNGTNATFSLNADPATVNGLSRLANTVLTVSLTGAPTTITAGTVPGLQIPATVINQSGNNDTSGNLWNTATAGQDLVLDSDAVDNQNNSGDTTAPTATSNDVVAGHSAQAITFSEAINPATLICADITTSSTETCTGIVMSFGNTVATVTYSDTLEAGDVLTLAANSLTDVAGNPGPALALNETA